MLFNSLLLLIVLAIVGCGNAIVRVRYEGRVQCEYGRQVLPVKNAEVTLMEEDG
jgi:hypothetical protein